MRVLCLQKAMFETVMFFFATAGCRAVFARPIREEKRTVYEIGNVCCKERLALFVQVLEKCVSYHLLYLLLRVCLSELPGDS